MNLYSHQVLAFLLFVLVSCLLASETGPLNLSPVNVRDWEHVLGKRHRHDFDFSDLALKNRAQLIWSKNGVHAKMMLHAQDGRDIVLLESFDGLTKTVDCKGDDGSMSLTFISQAAFEHALEYWSFINEDQKKDFLLIANHDGCGPDDQRQPYIITNIHEDKSTLTTHLISQVAKWRDIAGTFDLDFGHILPSNKSARRLRKRFDLKDLGEGIVNAIGSVFGKYDPDKGVGFDVALGDRRKKTGVFNFENKIIIDCINCFVQGHYQVTGRIRSDGFRIIDFLVDTTTQNAAAAVQVEAQLTETDYLLSKGLYKELIKKDIPDGGMEILGILKIGVKASYGIGVNVRFQGKAIIDLGLEAQLPDGATIHASAAGAEASTAVGFGGGPVKPFLRVKSVTASLEMHLYSELTLAVAGTLFDLIHLEVALNFRIPSIKSHLSVGYVKAGYCSATPGSSTTGASLISTFDTSVKLATEITLGPGLKQPDKYNELWGFQTKLEDLCYPISIPGLTPNVPGTNVPGTNVPDNSNVPGANIPGGVNENVPGRGTDGPAVPI